MRVHPCAELAGCAHSLVADRPADTIAAVLETPAAAVDVGCTEAVARLARVRVWVAHRIKTAIVVACARVFEFCAADSDVQRRILAPAHGNGATLVARIAAPIRHVDQPVVTSRSASILEACNVHLRVRRSVLALVQMSNTDGAEPALVSIARVQVVEANRRIGAADTRAVVIYVTRAAASEAILAQWVGAAHGTGLAYAAALLTQFASQKPPSRMGVEQTPPALA